LKEERELYEEVPILKKDWPSENHVKRGISLTVAGIT
jgi:hypothetical protein